MAQKFDEAVVHIGFPKTATTTIQATLHQNRDRLEQSYGTLYPADGTRRNHNRVLYLAFTTRKLSGREVVAMELARVGRPSVIPSANTPKMGCEVASAIWAPEGSKTRTRGSI